MYSNQKMIFKMLILFSFLQYTTANEEAKTKLSSSHCNTSLKMCSGYLKAEPLSSLPLTTLPPNLNSGRDIYERSWTTILPIFFLILFGTLCIHCCHRCYTRGNREPSSQAIIPSAPTAPTSPLLSPPLVVTFASIHSNPFEQHMTPHTASLLVRPSIRDADPRARPPIGPLLQFRGIPYDGNPAPSAPSAELVVTPQVYRPPMNPSHPDLPPPYHLALQLEEPPPPYSEIRTH